MSIPTPETWHVFPENDGYEISSIGNVRRIKPAYKHPVNGKNLILHLSTSGYKFAVLRRGGRITHYNSIHVFVMRTFVGPRPSGYEINHKDGNKLNNNILNLEYVTQADNNKHSIAVGLMKPKKLTPETVLKIRECCLGKPKQYAVIGRMFGISNTMVRNIDTQRSWNHV